MKLERTFLGLLFVALVWSTPVFSSGRSTPEPNVVVNNAILKLDREVSKDTDSAALMADLIEKEFGTQEEELKWGLEQKVGWGGMTALALIQASTGKSFAEMVQDGARRDFWAYAENAGMSGDKMARSLDGFLRRAERERNTRIFDKLRSARRVHPIPDLGNGFGLFQEALDFRHIDIQQPTKIHDVPGELAKGGQ